MASQNENFFPFSKTKQLFWGKIPILLAIFTLLVSIYLPFNSYLFGFLGKYLLVLIIPMILGAILSIWGCKNILNQKEIAFTLRFSSKNTPQSVQINSETLVVLGAVVGITQILAFLPFFLHSIIELVQTYNSRQLDQIPSSDLMHRDAKATQKQYRALLILPVLTSYYFLAMFVINTEDRAWIPWAWRGRFGLSLWETLWDVQLFWGEFWSNLMLVLLLSAMLLYKFPPHQNNLFKFSESHEKSFFKWNLGIACVFLLSMLFTAIIQKVQVNILENWYRTQFGYQVVSWPFIIAVAGLLIFSIKTYSHQSITSKIPWILICLFTASWMYLVSISDFSPEIVLSFGIPIYYAISTIAFPVCMVVYLIQRIKSSPNSNSGPENQNFVEKPIIASNKPNPFSYGLFWLVIVLISALFLIGLQYLKSTSLVPTISSSMWDFEMDWYIGLSHWPIWIYDVTLIFSIVFGSRLYFHGKKFQPFAQKVEKSVNTPQDRQFFVRSTISWHKIQSIVLIGMISSMIIFPLVKVQNQWSQSDPPVLLVNQVGYLPDSPKKILYQVPSNLSSAYFDDLPLSIPFEIRNLSNNVIISGGNLTKLTERYGYKYMIGYFDNLTLDGNYYACIHVDNREITSYSFKINSDVYDEIINLCLRFFYYQRCNYAVEEIVPGYPGHAACHLDDAEVWDGSKWIQINLHGGWHDAGDYNKYNSWFQTQWYCTQALAEGALLDPNSAYNSITSLYDTSLPDIVDETLWGLQFLINSINREGILGEGNRSRIWKAVSGYRHFNDREGRMSYSGLPEQDWSTPRRVVLDNGDYFTGAGQGFNFAGTILQAARLIDEIKLNYPIVVLPTWVPINTTELRQIANDVYQKDLELQGSAPNDHLGVLTGKLLYAEELGRIEGNNWTLIDTIINQSLPLISEQEDWAFWFGWVGYYQLGNILMHYLSNNRTVPSNVLTKISAIQQNHFTNLFDLPFQLKHSIVNNTEVLFYGMERQTDMMTSVWLESLIAQVNSSIANPTIIQSYLDWLFGLNPANICIMEGMGDRNYPQYHNRIQSAKNPRGAVPGAIPNGFALKPVSNSFLKSLGITSTDESIRQTAYVNYVPDEGCIALWEGNPYIKQGVPSSSNEIWIPHNAMMIRIMTSLLMGNVI